MRYLFLGGAPKCGTSALFDMLCQIPAISPSSPKETYYFLDPQYPLSRDSSNYHLHGLEGFDQYFDDSDKDIRLEATTHLIYQKEAPTVLGQLDATFVFVLREPAAKLRSTFEYTMNNLSSIKGSLSFSRYVELIGSDPEEIKKYERSPGSLDILKRGVYNSYYPTFLDHWKSQVGSERILVVDYEFFSKNPLSVVSGIALKMGLTVDETKIVASRKNATMAVKNKSLHSLFRKLNRQAGDNRFVRSMKQVYFRMQASPIKRSEQDINALEELKKRFDFNYKDLCDPQFRF